MKLRGVVLGVATALLALPSLAGEDRPPRALPLQESLEKARVDGKYAMLLRQVKVEQDYKEYGAFRDVGKKPASAEYHGVKEVPAGFWVYVYPYWYIWRDETAQPQAKRAWGPEQATGAPDTTGPGDVQTAWASLTPDGQDEWLLLEYADPVLPTAVFVHETFNPGALVRVTAFKLDGEEVELWKGNDPTPANGGVGVSEITVEASFKTNRVKLYIDSKAVTGWNEIDAVGLRDSSGKTHWATAADASSTYAEQGGLLLPGAIGAPPPLIFLPAAPPAIVIPAPPAVVLPGAPNPPPTADEKDKKIKQLDDENKDLKDQIKKLEERLRDK